jgi:hypothetical protein
VAFVVRVAFLYFWRRRAFKKSTAQTPANPLL